MKEEARLGWRASSREFDDLSIDGSSVAERRVLRVVG
jgi:hypothetical protein